ncbi:cytochrome P450 [Ephemerocybe angulata]|uniref:Cytochrome P450 n=1 Tax=Ephemerocybe angulata TaxID=980116 RepID=A0A8H6M661_9AGAR|nr:cytochrome P450 [Tulosesus angulatus]
MALAIVDRMTPLAQVALITASTWIFWRGLRRWLGSNPLDNIPGPPSQSWLAGHFEQLWDVKNGWGFHQSISEKYGGVLRLAGPLGKKMLYVFDPKALHQIMVKELYTFEESPGFTIGADISLGKGLLATQGAWHKKQRKMLNPVFSIAHMKGMVPIFYDVVDKLRDTFEKKIENGPVEIDVTSWMARTALELIGQSGLGYSFDSLEEGTEEHPYCNAAKMYIPVTNNLMTSRFYLLPLIHKLNLPPRFLRWLVDIVPWKDLHDARDIVDVMWDTATKIVESKKQAIREGDDSIARQVGKGKDIISILIKANMQVDEAERLSDEEVLGQVGTLTFTATDSTSSALSRILHVLCERVDWQDKLRAEIKDAQKKHGVRLDYDVLNALPLMDAVCRETLRLYPPVSTLLRETVADVMLPFSKPIIGVDGKEIGEVLVPKGTMIFPSLLGSNRNPDVWGPTAYEWRPERWIEGLPESVLNAKVPGIYSHLMTFIGGGRACIGFKFSQLEMKVALCTLLSTFKFAAPKDKEIYWQMASLVTPTVNGSSKPSLPLIVSRAD